MRVLRFLLIVVFLSLTCLATSVSAYEPSLTGPETEKRFPPLTVPPGFKATLFACDPLVEYPSVISIGPKPGTLFVAYDYMTGLGIEIVRRDEIRIVADTDGDGYADKSKLYAGGFNSIQGLAFHNGSVYVMHAPYLTSLQDTDGDGVADKRTDLLKGLGLPPEENSNRLHCANGVTVGHDGWLYLALGDRGCDVERYEGDRLVFREGCILRCRFDGHDLHVFSHGLRNIYDVALDAELNVFVRDNENDGGDYMIRVCHCFHGSDHGYPYLYYERPAEAMLPLADLGRGSSAGITAYLETAFPKEFRESLFCSEWGRSVVRYQKQRSGSSFAAMQEVDFAAGADTDPYGFKPTDVVVDYDGSLLISDWGDGQRPKRGRARIYRISAVSDQQKTVRSNNRGKPIDDLILELNSPSYSTRVAAQNSIQRQGGTGAKAVRKALDSKKLETLGRLHAIWILTQVESQDAIEVLFEIAKSDSDPSVRAQAIHALADLTDPVLVSHRLNSGRGDVNVAKRLAALVTTDQNPQVSLEVVVALGRLSWVEAPAWLGRNWNGADPALAHASMKLLRRSDNWPAVLSLLDSPENDTVKPTVRTLALQALANQSNDLVAEGLIARLKTEKKPQRRSEYADLLTRIYKRPAEWVYWGFRPGPRPANPVVWKKTNAIGQALERSLSDADFTVRAKAVRRMRREEIPVSLKSLVDWLNAERDAGHVAEILTALGDHPADSTQKYFDAVVREKNIRMKIG
jgi:putative membrane-bound dehydrogenase-like protein